MATAAELRKEVSDGKELMKEYLQTLQGEHEEILKAKETSGPLFSALRNAIETGNSSFALTVISTLEKSYNGYLKCYEDTLIELRTAKVEGGAEIEKYFLLAAELKDRGIMK